MTAARTMKSLPALLLTALLVAVIAPQAAAQGSDPLAQVAWKHGPTTGTMGDKAEIKVPYGYVFTDSTGTRQVMEAFQNPISGTEVGFLGPESLDWFFVFEFDDVGYVKDDEKDELDADAIFDSIVKGTEAANKEREKRGWAPIEVYAWHTKPHYDAANHNLEWGIRAESEGQRIVNYNTRILGREGVMRVTLVCDPQQVEATLPVSKKLLADFSYAQGHRYEEWRKGDRLAKYGLTALVAGGAAAVAAKTGLLKHLWKLIVAGVVAIGALLKKIFGRKD